jgi:hypothetical protein
MAMSTPTVIATTNATAIKNFMTRSDATVMLTDGKGFRIESGVL